MGRETSNMEIEIDVFLWLDNPLRGTPISIPSIKLDRLGYFPQAFMDDVDYLYDINE